MKKRIKVKVILNKDQAEFIEELSRQMRVSKSAIVRGIIRYVMSRPSIIYSIEPLIYEESRGV